ncbi:MAG: beta-lactamase family protein [Gemmatimonadetes bacterium]|nr:beta-lactamase family protein [Gemmatimonadota bacterium]
MLKHAALALLAVSSAATAPVSAQLGTPVDGATPPGIDLRDAVIAEFVAGLAADAAADSAGSLGAALVVGDSVAWAGAFGLADRENGRSATVETLYRVGSITKVLTAATALRLAEKGVIELDEPVAVWVPEIVSLAGLQTTDRPITLRDLASHTAGLEREPSSSLAARGHRAGWKRKTLASIPLTELRSSPGSAYTYSNVGYAILGLAVERAGGRSFEGLVAREVLETLGMRSSFFAVPRRERHRLAAGYVNLEDGTADPRVPRAEHRGRGYKVPSEGLYSTVGDLARLVMALSGALGDTLLDDDARAAMLTAPALQGDDRTGYGLGLQLTRIGGTLLAGHSGTTAGYTSYLVFDPATRVGVVILRSYNRGATNLGAAAQRVVMELGAAALH